MKHHPLVLDGKRFVAEFIGTLLLAATVGVSVLGFSAYGSYENLYIPFGIGTLIAVLVYTLGPVSGAHFNPSVTLALFSFRKLSLQQLVGYLIAQFVGAAIGWRLVEVLMGISPIAGEKVGQAALLGEFLGAFLLVFTVTNVVIGKIPAAMSGLVIGLALACGITLSMAASGGVLNPALAFSMNLRHITYLVFPLLGGIVGAGLALWFDSEK